ncbi:hypothetical protein FQZ97_1095100 [compost metagenome]
MARAALAAASLSEPINWLGKGSWLREIGAKPRKGSGQLARCTSAGATSNAPNTLRSDCSGARAAQRATVMQPRL